ncbi:MAG: hypothetical protein JWL63_2403 [Rhodocyclales bacterium]|nr:hypothetical protein [Rhodocyclales bacterium]
MIALAFLCGIAVLFAMVLFWESTATDGGISIKPAGLIRWLVSGNWPAKVGAILLLIGTGALLRYLMLNIKLPADAKLATGIVIAAVLGCASGLLKNNHKRRSIHLALGGAALGVAYLTAYSAYGYFKFVTSIQALTLLFAVACAATTFAVTRRALSIALLAMIGAFIAPAFALESPGPAPVYGYYVIASLLSLMMVWLRGWRPLIHLGFLFTLAGALFFGWTQNFYEPAYYREMQPLLLALVAIYLAMPLLEFNKVSGRITAGVWLQRFDTGYFLLLPLVSAVLTLTIAPDASVEGAIGIALLGVLWALAAAVQHRRHQTGALRYLCVALLLLLTGALLTLENIPYSLVAIVVSCALLAAGPKIGVSRAFSPLLITTALAAFACYLLQAIFTPVIGSPFLNAQFLRHSVVVFFLGAAAFSLHRQRNGIAPLFITLTIAWAVLTCARELLRLHFEYLAQASHLAALLLCFGYAIWLVKKAPRIELALLLVGALFVSGLLGARLFPSSIIILMMLAGQTALLAIAHMSGRHTDEGEYIAAVVRSCLPVVILPWALAYSGTLVAPTAAVIATILVTSALIASLHAQWAFPSGQFWPNLLSPVGFILSSCWLFYQTLFHIQRDPWAIAYELIALAYIAQSARFLTKSGNRDARWFGIAAVTALLSVSAAMFLRFFGPVGTLTILALNDMLMPAVVSLLCAVAGGVMTWWGMRTQSRRQWLIGALLLLIAAAKLVLFDFGSLGQLANILAMMGAGCVFLVVAWLAPFPPKAEAADQDAFVVPAQPVAMPEKPLASRTMTEEVARSVQAPPTPNSDASTQAVTQQRATTFKGNAQYAPSKMMDEETGSRKWLWILVGVVTIIYFSYSNQRPSTSAQYAEVLLTSSEPLATETPADHPAAANEMKASATEQPVMQAPADACSRFAQQLPANYEVHAAGEYAGRALGYQSNTRGHEMTGIDVYVDKPGLDVVLALGTYEPTVWNIQSANGTHVVGVIISGYHAGEARGLASNIPVLQTSYEDGTPCGYFSISADKNQAAYPFISKLLTRALDSVQVPTNHRVEIGKVTTPKNIVMQATPRSYGSRVSCKVPVWNQPTTSCTGKILASGSMSNFDSPEDAARNCERAGVGGSCCMYHLYGVGSWYVTDGAPQQDGRACEIEPGGAVNSCKAGGSCASN